MLISIISDDIIGINAIVTITIKKKINKNKSQICHQYNCND